MAERKLQALRNEWNEGLQVASSSTAWVLHGGEYSVITPSTGGEQLHWRLSCGKHLRRCTANAIRDEQDLFCRFCTHRNTLKARHMAVPSKHEARMQRMLDGMGWAARWRPQVYVEPWRGLVDFMIMPECVLLQVDGEGHFCKSMYGVPTADQQRTDLEMAASAWRMGHALLRVHHRDLTSKCMPSLLAAVATHRQQSPTLPLLVLTASYSMHTLSPAQRPAAHAEYLARLQRCLGSACARADCDNNTWWEPSM